MFAAADEVFSFRHGGGKFEFKKNLRSFSFHFSKNQYQSDQIYEVPPSRRSHSEKCHFALPERKVDRRYLELGTLENESGDVRGRGWECSETDTSETNEPS